MTKIINWIINKIKILRLTVYEVEEMFREGQFYDDCTMVMEDYGECHDFPCTECVHRVHKEIKSGTLEI